MSDFRVVKGLKWFQNQTLFMYLPSYTCKRTQGWKKTWIVRTNLKKIDIRSAPPNSTTESILSSTLLLYFMQQGKQVNEFLGLYLTSNEPG